MDATRIRELLGNEAHGMTDEQLIALARHAEAMARVIVSVAIEQKRKAA